MRKLHRAGFGEMHAIAGAQPPDLAFEVGALHRVASLVVDEAVPDIDVHDAGLLRPRAIELVEIGSCRWSRACRGSPAARPRAPARPWLLSAAIISSMRLA